MATEADQQVIHALARCIAIQRDLFRDSAEAVAARHRLTVDQLVEALVWCRAVEPHYRGTAEAEAAEAAATALRHPLIQPATERLTALEGEPGRLDRDRPDRSKPKRRCVRCGRRFQPTVKRWQTCVGCFNLAENFGVPF